MMMVNQQQAEQRNRQADRDEQREERRLRMEEQREERHLSMKQHALQMQSQQQMMMSMMATVMQGNRAVAPVAPVFNLPEEKEEEN